MYINSKIIFFHTSDDLIEKVVSLQMILTKTDLRNKNNNIFKTLSIKRGF